MRQRISLRSYQDARQGCSPQSAGNQLLVIVALTFGTATAAAPTVAAIKWIPQSPLWIWKVLGIALVSLTVAIPIVLWAIRRPERLAAAKVLLQCPGCGSTPSESTVMTTGRCDECFAEFVELPVLTDDSSLPNQSDVSAAWRKSMSPRTLTLCLVLPLVPFLGAFVAAAYDFRVIAGVMGFVGIVGLFAGLGWVARTRSQAGLPQRCSDCNETYEGQAILSVIATCRCPFCGAQVLAPSSENVPVEQRFRREEIKVHVERVRRSQLKGILCVMIMMPIGMLCFTLLDQNTLSGSIITWAWCLLCCIPVAHFFRCVARASHRCPVCDSRIEQAYLLMTTGNCCFCGSQICK